MKIPTSKSQIPNPQQGFIAITSILVVSAVVLAITISISFLAIGQGQSGLAVGKGESALSFVEGCAEDALWKLRASASYTGGTITRPEGTCSITVNGSGPYTLTITTSAADYKRTIQIVATRGTQIVINSWKEI